MCFDPSRNFIYLDPNGEVLKKDQLAKMPLPDPELGWFVWSEWYIDKRTFTSWQELEELCNSGAGHDLPLSEIISPPFTARLCWVCQIYIKDSTDAAVRHCDTWQHRSEMSQLMGLPTQLGPSWRVPIPDTHCTVCQAKNPQDNELVAMMGDLGLANEQAPSMATPGPSSPVSPDELNKMLSGMRL